MDRLVSPGLASLEHKQRIQIATSVAFHVGEAAADAANFFDSFLALNPWIIACIAFFAAATVWFERRT
jgi:hypothetical protein